MQTHITTTPFGRRPMTLGLMASQVAAKSMPQGARVEKWKTFHAIRDAKEPIGATDRALAILNALLSFHPENELTSEGELIVWPSNEQLMARANGIPPTTLRRHLAVLVDCGLIVRRDSPNGKRFARKGKGGQVEQAYGFDLSPIVARAEEFEQLAEAVQAEKKAFKFAKERLTLLRRDIVKMIDAGIEEGVPGNWGRVQQIYQEIIGRLPRSAPRRALESLCEELHELWTEVHDILESFTKTQNLDANCSATKIMLNPRHFRAQWWRFRSGFSMRHFRAQSGRRDHLRKDPRVATEAGIPPVAWAAGPACRADRGPPLR